MTIKKKIYVSIFSILSVAVVVTIAMLVTWKVISISYNMKEKVEGVDSTITISRDSMGIPHIEASSLKDVYFSLGYIHAKDRLDLIEYDRALATGNSAEYARKEGELLNAIAGTIGFTRRADKILLSLNQEQQGYLESYCAGINHIREGRPSSFFLPSAWTPRDVIAILVMKEWANSYLNSLELIMNLQDTKKLSLEKILPGKKYIHYYNADDTENLETLRKIREVVKKYMGTFNRGFYVFSGSSLNINDSNYYISFAYNDSYSSYPGWYPVKILLNNRPVDSITYSGLPFIFAFRNSTRTMIHFNINADTADFILVDTEEKDEKTRYRLNGKWQDFTTVRAPQGAGTSELIWLTERGPVLNSLSAHTATDNRMLVIDSVLPGSAYVQLLFDAPFSDLNQATLKKSITDSDASLKCFIITSENESLKAYSGYVSAVNDSSVFKSGNLYLKQSFTKFSWFKTGLSIDYSGSDVIPGTELAAYRNSIITDELKIERINQVLLPRRIYSEEKILSIIDDNKSPAAQKFIPLFRSILEPNPLTSAKLTRIYFSDWDYNTSYENQAPGIFYVTLNYFIYETLRDEFGVDFEYNRENFYLLYSDFYSLIMQNQLFIYDNPETPVLENRENIFDVSFFNAMRFLNRKTGPIMDEWSFSRTNAAKFTLPRLKFDILYNIFSVDSLPVNGGPDTLMGTVSDSDFDPVSGRSISGLMNMSSFKISMNTGYSTSLLSEFFYGKKGSIKFTDIGKVNLIYKTVIEK